MGQVAEMEAKKLQALSEKIKVIATDVKIEDVASEIPKLHDDNTTLTEEPVLEEVDMEAVEKAKFLAAKRERKKKRDKIAMWQKVAFKKGRGKKNNPLVNGVKVFATNVSTKTLWIN